MNLLQNRTMHPPLRDEEALVIENAIRLAIDSIINVLYSVNGARTREYERMLGVRDKEIRRLSGREKDFERELQLLRRQGCSCGLYDDDDAAAAAAEDEDDHCGSGFPDPLLQNPDCGDPGGPGCGDPGVGFDDPRPGCEDARDEMAAAHHGQCEMTFSLGLFDTSPSQVSAQSQDLGVPPPPAIRSSFQQPAVQPAPEASAPLDQRPAPSNGPVIKEEPSDTDAICESSDLHGMLGHGALVGEFRGGLYPGPEPLGLGGPEQHMMRRRNPPHATETPGAPSDRRRTGGPPPHMIGDDGTEMAQDVTPAVLAALPSLPERKLQALLNQLSVIGVESEGDLQLVREADLHHILTPLQCRRLLDAWRGDDEYASLGGADPATAEDRASSPAPPAHSPPGGASPDGSTLGPSSWPDSFVVPWTRMPACVTAAVALNDRPTPKSRREMVRIVVDEMRLRDLNPTRADCVAVAKRMVREYPDSFADVLSDGTTRVGSGYGSLVAQLKTRVEHVNRGNALARHRKPKRAAAAATAEEAARGPDDRYGCVRRQPGRPPHHASDEPLRRKQQQQQEMKELFGADEGPGAGPTQRGRVGPLTEETYPLQRRAIDARPPPSSVDDPRTAWPRLFTPRGLYDHFQRLTDVAVLERMERALAEKGRLIVDFFERKPVGTDTARVQALLRRFGSGEGSAVGPCAVLLLMAHLNEEVEALILEADVLATAAEAERALELPVSPRLIVLGDVLTAGRWMLSMEGRVVVPAHPDFVAGLAALFSAYYAFNLAYQEGASCTLEFIQRCFLGLNPPLGTKAPSSKNTSDVRVSAFLRRLIDFDWLFV